LTSGLYFIFSAYFFYFIEDINEGVFCRIRIIKNQAEIDGWGILELIIVIEEKYFET
jgi:hypothetical protein